MTNMSSAGRSIDGVLRVALREAVTIRLSNVTRLGQQVYCQAGVTERNAQDKVIDAVRYWYDATGTRVGMTVEATGEATATTTYVIDHHNPTGYSQVLEERDASNEVVRAYTLGHDLIAQMDVSAPDALDRYYFAYDGHRLHERVD